MEYFGKFQKYQNQKEKRDRQIEKFREFPKKCIEDPGTF